VPLSFGFLSPYPSRQHGLDTFTQSLSSQLATNGHRTGVVRMVDSPPSQPVPVDAALDPEEAHNGASSAAATLATFDVAVVQYEFDIQRGIPATMAIAVGDRLTVPVIVVVHAVHARPTSHLRVALQQMVHHAAAVVTTSDSVRRQLICDYGIAAATVVVIPHGPLAYPTARNASGEPPTILTWGLLGPGAGIESMIDAMVTLGHLEPAPRYAVVGPTHPKILGHDGEAYRHWLMARTIDRDVARLVSFHAARLTGVELSLALANADVVVLPYQPHGPTTSEVLVDTMAAGKPVVATAFPQAVQLLSDGAGLVVPHDDPLALVDALRRVLTEPNLAATMSRRAIAVHPERAWPAIAHRYERLAEAVVGNRLPTAV
jgi:polysaccharide biosynthesis protein PslF